MEDRIVAGVLSSEPDTARKAGAEWFLDPETFQRRQGDGVMRALVQQATERVQAA
jgi:hypothetical protein